MMIDSLEMPPSYSQVLGYWSILQDSVQSAADGGGSGGNNVFVILSSQMELVGTHDTQLLCELVWRLLS